MTETVLCYWCGNICDVQIGVLYSQRFKKAHEFEGGVCAGSGTPVMGRPIRVMEIGKHGLE
jgi:hypothetical protein